MKKDDLIKALQNITEDNAEIFCNDSEGYPVPIKVLTVKKVAIPFKDVKYGFSGCTDDKVFIVDGQWTEEEINTN